MHSKKELYLGIEYPKGTPSYCIFFDINAGIKTTWFLNPLVYLATV